jgi:hypothetical protein
MMVGSKRFENVDIVADCLLSIIMNFVFEPQNQLLWQAILGFKRQRGSVLGTIDSHLGSMVHCPSAIMNSGANSPGFSSREVEGPAL